MTRLLRSLICAVVLSQVLYAMQNTSGSGNGVQSGAEKQKQAEDKTNHVKVKLRAALFDRDLNIKPVPRLSITLSNLDAPGEAPIKAQTSLDGVVELEIKPATYQLTTNPAELTGKAFVWDLTVKLTNPQNVLELSNDNARMTDLTGGRGARVDELADQYTRVKDSVVIVWTEDAAFDGVLVDPAGLVLTSYSLVEGHDWLAVQFDETHKVRAQLLAFDKPGDVAVLRVNVESIPHLVVAQVAADPGALVAGERVFALKNTLDEGKLLMTGVVSKASKDAIAADVKLPDPGGPLFSSTGAVVGYVRVEGKKLAFAPVNLATATLNTAKEKMKDSEPLSAHLLPCHPQQHYPVDALRATGANKWQKEIYLSKLGDFEVEFVTPVSSYATDMERYSATAKEREKALKKGKELPTVKEPDYKYYPVLVVGVRPRVSVAFWKSFGDSVLTDGHAPDTYNYKSSFVRMKLLCGGKEVEPIWPRRTPVGGYGFRNYSKAGYAVVQGASFEGSYIFPYDAVSQDCGQVTLAVTAAKDEKPLVKVLEPAVINRLVRDFAAYQPPASGQVTQK